MKSQGWERWLSCWEHFLIFQKTWVWFPASAWASHPPAAPALGTLRCVHIHVSAHSHTDTCYIHNFKKTEKWDWDFWKGLHWTLNLRVNTCSICALMVFILYEHSMFVIGQLQNWTYSGLDDFRGTELSVSGVSTLLTLWQVTSTKFTLKDHIIEFFI